MKKEGPIDLEWDAFVLTVVYQTKSKKDLVEDECIGKELLGCRRIF